MEQLKDFDIAEHLTTEEEIQLYLNEILQEDNIELILSALGDIARARNISQISRETGISREGLYKALSGKGNPTFATVLKVMKALNLQFEVKVNNAIHA
ncbi:putative addiction module antidote protein [Pasteurella multocida]|uniref:addiction module antidote protein n=1 Tax=Pasteurella multocida TaxID=747 RepID=UPI00187AA986|nr:addiction module antidote protein [Pasteurella multocida]MBE7395129.1 putative addiction module antidote protein [Pasteurella multocida]MCL7761664.1 putative addiction module antidote protein [Pasteurella multocida]MCL7774819.1 putative addiction module antidote protein [Pasteurella multocida]MCL7783481.1 putative addiction module antidote protein [Pasteurella multocida]MCL7785652.1 putative addiction module antidote protein [Pasteurella multocida]